ncbi:MAG: ABC transporter ATP-binding protein [Victivallales bacterium]|nr:ABC transporter ATP-binding protein [Victivallales bacterium]
MLKVELQNISKSYQPGKPILKPFDLTVAPGELFFLLGPSGCGKSTLLRLLAGFLQPDSGTIRFDDSNVTTLPPEKRDTGMVFQNYALWPHMTVGDNVGFALDMRRIRGIERQHRLNEALAMVDMEEFADRRPASLSGGQQQRVALARAIVFKPRLLLLDEPLSNLDAKLRDSMRQEIRRICKETGLTAVYVTHDRKEALSMADRIAILHQGKLEQTGTPETLYRRPATRFTAGFMGQANFFPATVNSSENGYCTITSPWGKMQTAMPEFASSHGQRCTGMIRPECFTINHPENGSNRISAELTDHTFLGETSTWDFSAAGFTLKVSEPGISHYKAGQSATLGVTPENIVLLNEDY